MALTVALELDRTGVRAAVVDDASGKPVVARMASASLAEDADVQAAAEALRNALPEVRWSRARLVGVVGGDQVRLRLLNLPPTPDAELPDMVRLQAAREFATAEGEGVVDYVPVSDDPGAPRSVLAASVSREVLDRLGKLAGALDGTLAGVSPRGCGAGWLAMRLSPELRSGIHLIVAAADEAVDLVVVQEGRPSLLRSAKAPADALDAVVRSEARRTSAMASQQIGDRVGSHVFFGFDEHPELTGAASLGLAGLLSEGDGQPAAELDLAPQLIGLIGTALESAEQQRPSIDFLNPRQPVQDHSAHRRVAVLAIAAAACVLLGVGLAAWRLWSLDAKIAAKKLDLKNEESEIEQLEPFKQRADAVEQWLTTDVNWLEEFDRLGHKLRPAALDEKEFPADQDVYIRKFTATPLSQSGARGGLIQIQALLRSPNSSDEIEQRLRDQGHSVETSSGTTVPSGGQYGWEATTTLRVSSGEERS